MTSDGLLRFLRVARSTTRSHGGGLPKEYHYFNVGILEQFVPLDLLSDRVQQVAEMQLAGEEREDVDRAQRALVRRAQGKPDFSLMSGSYDEG